MKSHERYGLKFSFNFPLLVDEGGVATEAYGACCNEKGYPLRSVYIVDKQGMVRFAQRGSPSDEELLEVLKALPR
jgi:thioredoxin-dependent peroxiredoxin